MARESNSPLTSVQSILSLAANRRAASQDLPAAILELAAALIQADTEINRSQTSAGDHGAKDLTAIVNAWANVSAQLISAIARPLGELQSVFSGNCYSTHQQSILAAAERLAHQTRQSSELLQQMSNELKSESRALMLRAGAVGRLSRAHQKERLRLSEHLQKAQELEAEIAQKKSSQPEASRTVEMLHERLRLATASESEREEFERKVLEKEQEVRNQEGHLEELQRRQDEAEQKHRELADQIASKQQLIENAKQLISQAEQSGDLELVGVLKEMFNRAQSKGN